MLLSSSLFPHPLSDDRCTTQANGDPNGQYVEYGVATGNQNIMQVQLPRQCAAYHLKTAVTFQSPDGFAPQNISCVPLLAPVSFYVRSKPADPDLVNASAMSNTAVALEWRLVDSGGCSPVAFRLQLFTVERQLLQEVNITDTTPNPLFPAMFAYVMQVSPPTTLPLHVPLFVGVQASTAAGHSYPITSNWFEYGGPARLPAAMIAAIACSVIGGALLVACLVSCVYRKCISRAYYDVLASQQPPSPHSSARSAFSSPGLR